MSETDVGPARAPEEQWSPIAKCVVWDLDDTVWSGTLTADDELRVRPGVREAIVGLDERGVLQSVASKNNHDDALQRLRECGLEHYFLEPQITWSTKSSSIAEIQRRLNIGMDTIVLVDDQEFERDEVAFHHPQVETIAADEVPGLLSMPRLSPAVVTDDARRRREMYVQDRQRELSERDFVGPRDDFLAGLDMRCVIALAEDGDLDRLEELTRRTNQLNSTGIHYSYDDLSRLRADPGHELWVCALTDTYGDYGKVGLALVATQDDRRTIKLLLMSCRTVSKGVGTVLLTFLVDRCRAEGKKLFADFRRTPRNRQMLLTYQLSGFEVVDRKGDQLLYENDLRERRALPEYLKVEIHDEK